MVLILPEHSQRPYRYGMTLLCIGAMFNWLGLADNNAEPVRYIGVTLIAAGAMLICLAMCFWMKATHDPQVAALQADQDMLHHVIVSLDGGEPAVEKPPDYETVTGELPPSYEDAIKLGPSGANGSKPEGEQPQSGSSGEPSSSAPMAKPPDSSGPDEDNFGSKVLRISRRLLQRTRGLDPEEGVAAASALPSPVTRHQLPRSNQDWKANVYK